MAAGPGAAIAGTFNERVKLRLKDSPSVGMGLCLKSLVSVNCAH